ncbi:glycosyltransferase family 2 protein [Limosilactobacillus reuteri]|uniref:glycosyltransferase family 2 protein n=1 Tax=Limosilactobacillus reuteri TaxID=1598 RepID=UPI00298C6C49|nr:glycosyltransferase [Limosilactobacillus reuteri]
MYRLISIIVPVYNKENYIGGLIKQLRKQTYKDFEVIFVDDGSSDSSYETALKYTRENNNTFVYKQENSGVSVARNKGIEKAKGEWISFLDPDDSITDDYLEELLRVSDQCDIVCCCCYAYDNDGKYLNDFFNKDRVFEGDNKVDLFRQLLDDTYCRDKEVYTAIGVPWGKLYKKDFIIDNNLRFNDKLKRQQDNIFNMHAFYKATRIKYINKALYYYQIEHVKDYYKSKFDKYALINAEELQKERYDFFIKEGHFDDKLTQKIFNDETISVLIGAFNKSLMNKENNFSYREKKKNYSNVIENDYFGEIIKKLKISDIHGSIHKIVALAMKHQLFYPIYFIWSFRGIYEKIKFR